MPEGELSSAEDVEPDLLTVAHGATPIDFTVEGPGGGIHYTGDLITAIDGDPSPWPMIVDGSEETTVEFTLRLPASTTFERIYIPQVLESSSSGSTFFGSIEVLGSSSLDGPYTTLAQAGLEPHSSPEEITDLEIVSDLAVQFVRVRLSGGVNIEEDLSFLQFSEIVGNGNQEALDLADAFTGIWDARTPDFSDRSIGLIELRQDGVVVTGCFNDFDLVGTVVGNLVHLSGVSRETGFEGFYVFTLNEEGELVGVQAVNSPPRNLTLSEIAAEGSTTECSDVPEPEHAFSCGSTVYGINFDVDSATLRPESTPVLDEVYQGLAADDSSVIVVEGHTSSEGSTEYNQELSELRAQAVVDYLVASGLDPTRMSAVGKGESELLISPDSDETSRIANRRVEIVCES